MVRPDLTSAGVRERLKPRSWTLAITLALFATLTAGVPASAQSQNCDPDDGISPNLMEPVEICGTVVLEGNKPGSVKVHFPVDLILSAVMRGPAPRIDIEGGGPFTGVLITQGRPTPDVYGQGDDSFLLVGCLADRFGFTRPDNGQFERSCNSWSGGRFFQNLDYKYPAGDYLIHLVTDGSPARVTLRFASSLNGSLELSPQHASTVEMKEYEPDLLPQAEAKVFAVDGSGEIRDQGISVAVTTTSSSSSENAMAQTWCTYTVHHIYQNDGAPVGVCLGPLATSRNAWASVSSSWMWRRTGQYGWRIAGAHAPANPPRALLMWVSAEYPAWI